MSVNSTEGGTFIGVVVEGDDNSPDPYGMGRVKVLCPSIHHKDITTSELPWCILASNPDGLGTYTHNRAPAVGSVVEVFFAPGTKSSGYGVVRSVINGVHNTDPQSLIGEDPTRTEGMGENLSQSGYVAKSRRKTPSRASGPATQSQSSSGAAVKGTGASYKSFPSMHNREGIDTTLSSKGFIRTNKGFQSITRAEQWVHFTYDTGGAGIGLPPISYDSIDYDINPGLGGGIPNELLKRGFMNFASYAALKYVTDKNSTNFSNESSRTGGGWSGQAQGQLSSSMTHKLLQDNMHQIQTRSFLLSAKSNGNAGPVETPFGQMGRTANPNGFIEFKSFDSCNEKKWKFIKKKVNKLPTARIDIDPEGGLFKDSLVPGETMLRVKPSSASTIKDTIEKLVVPGDSLNLGIYFKRYHGGEHITRGPNEMKEPEE